jgi:hypothetical protein
MGQKKPFNIQWCTGAMVWMIPKGSCAKVLVNQPLGAQGGGGTLRR